MNLLDRAELILQMARAGWSWLRLDTEHPSPVPGNPRFMSPRDAAALVQDGHVVAVSGVAGQQRSSVVYRAIRERFERQGHPANLTVVNVGGHGGRGLVPGTLEELGRPGLCTRLITSHFETFHAMLDLAARGQCELQCLPLGTMTLLFDALGRGKDSRLSRTGVGTFLDPRVGRGSPVTDPGGDQLVTAHGNRLRYRMPPIDVAIFNVPAADRHGNLYARNSAVLCEASELARAARRNGGKVIANVGLLVDDDYDEVFLPAKAVDAPIESGLARVSFLNWITGITPRRSAADRALGRLAGAVLLGTVRQGGWVAIGTGMPEQVPGELLEAGLLDRVRFVVESGVIGGVPAPGIFFGAAVNPERILSSAELFKLCEKSLDATCLGALQVDGAGHVNVSLRGTGLRGYVGPGGFMDFTEAAETIVFVSAWMQHAEVVLEGGKLRIVRPGRPKFVDQVDEITFNGRHAVQQGKRVFYATHVGLFRLRPEGLELTAVMPGIDVRRDVLEASPARIRLPRSGRVAKIPASIVTGEGYPPSPSRRWLGSD